ncbi:MAG: DUF6034 family protein [Clostridiaceae bacterium]
MKRTLCALFAALLIIPALAACQKTPESPIVVGKNAEILIEKATATDSAPSVTENGDQITGAPQAYQVELANTQGNLLIHVDAEIDVPDVQTLSVARIFPREFTSDDVQRLYDTFCAGATSIGSDPVFTKAFQLRSYQDYLDMRKADVFPDMQYESMEEFDEAITGFMESLDSLPDEFTPAGADFTFDSRGMASCYAARSNELVSQISVSNAEGLSVARYYRDIYERNFIDGLRYSATDSYALTQDPRYAAPVMSLADARTIAVGAVASMGLGDFSVAAERTTCLWDVTSIVPTDTLKGAYEFIFTPAIDGVAFTYADGEANNQDNQSNQYDKAWYYEKVRVIVDNDGLNSVVWDAPFQSMETITDNASLLPYEQIQSIFERMMPIVFSHYNAADLAATCSVTINRITLGYMRIKEQNADGSGLIVPVWDFFGSYYRSDDPEGTTPQGSDGFESLLTINAIDGSIIDRTCGY